MSGYTEPIFEPELTWIEEYKMNWIRRGLLKKDRHRNLRYLEKNDYIYY